MTSKPSIGNAQVVVRVARIGIERDRGGEARDGAGDVAVFELQVAEVHEGGNARGVRLERKDQFIGCPAAVAARQVHERALVAGVRLRRRITGCERNGERLPRLIEPAGAQRFRAALDLAGRTGRGDSEESREERQRSMLHVDVITLFPEMFAPVIGLSIVGRAVERGLAAVTVHDLIDALAPGERADERPYGGGPGMVLRIEPLARLLDAIVARAGPAEQRAIVLTAAAGRPFRQPDAAAWSALDRLVVICGHYEGVDERLGALYPIHEVSLGPFVLTGGEIPAMALIDATVRLLDGAIAADSREAESFAGGPQELDHPTFTRPPVFRGVAVPEVLLSGDHARIAEWRRQRSRERSACRASRLNE